MKVKICPICGWALNKKFQLELTEGICPHCLNLVIPLVTPQEIDND